MKHLKQTVELGSTLVIAVVAVAMAYTYFQERRPSQGAGTREIADWERENEIGIRSGPADAVVVITEFVDLQCPFCAALAPIIDSIAAEFPDDVAVVFQHFPLQSHEHAIPAAIGGGVRGTSSPFLADVPAAAQRTALLSMGTVR